MIKTYSLNDPPGSLIVYAPDGSIAFDSRLMSQRIHLTGSGVLSARTQQPGPGGGVINVAGLLPVPYNKVFSKPPYVLSATRKLQADSRSEEFPTSRIYPPRLLYREGVATLFDYLKGAFTNAGTSQVYIGNASATGSSAAGVFHGEKRVWYAVFENEVA